MKIISLGAGVQSSTMFLMSCLGELPKVDYAIFADTQAEPKSVYEYLEFLKKQGEKYGIPVLTVTAGNLEQDTLDFISGKRPRVASIPFFVKTDNQALIGRQCTNDYKIMPIRKKVRELLKDRNEKHCEMWIGISTDEIMRMKDSRVKFIHHEWPLIDKRMDRNDCKQWYNGKDFPSPPRSACHFCPFHSNSEWQRLKMKEPEAFERSIKFDKEVRDHPKFQGKTFLHRSMEPIKNISFSDESQLDMFLNDCEGMCGV